MFFVRELHPDNYYEIFIEPNKFSGEYDNVIASRYSEWDSAFYRGWVQQLKAKTKFSRNDISGIPQSWHPLYLHKGRYYVYRPSDGMYDSWVFITDSTLIQYMGGEMIPDAIHKIRKEARMIEITSSEI